MSAKISFTDGDDIHITTWDYVFWIENQDGKPIIFVEDRIKDKLYYVELKEVFYDWK